MKLDVFGSFSLYGIYGRYNDSVSLANTDNGQQIHFGGTSSSTDLILEGYSPYCYVGIGTPATSALLTVGLAGGSGTKVVVNGGITATGGFTTSSTSPPSAGVLSVTASNPKVVLSSTNSTQQNTISTSGAGTYIDVAGHAIASNNIIVFRTTNVANSFNPSEAMRINSLGGLEIGTVLPPDSVQRLT